MTQTYLAKDRFQHPIQALEPNVVQNISFTTAGSTAITDNLNSNTVVIRVMATADSYVAIGPAASVTASSASVYLPAFLPEYFRVDQNAGLKVAARGVLASGTLNVVEMT
jgi:ApbE superfamily uncharacterized protein (UPF0280 family)